MGTRLELHSLLLSIVPNVYFQPPEDIQMVYPCIVYDRTDLVTKHANNAPFKLDVEYTLTVIDRDPDSDIPIQIAMLPKSRHERFFKADNLNQNIFTVFF